MQYVTCKIGGTEMYLLYSIGAMFELRQLYENADKVIYTDEDGDEREKSASLFDVINPQDIKGIENLFKTAAVMAEWGELYRRHLGHEPKRLFLYTELYDIIKPENYFEFKEAVYSAIVLGHSREIEENKEIDTALEEIRQKNNEKTGLSTYLAVGLDLGMTRKEILFERPGMLEDIVSLKNKGKEKATSEGDDF